MGWGGGLLEDRNAARIISMFHTVFVQIGGGGRGAEETAQLSPPQESEKSGPTTV